MKPIAIITVDTEPDYLFCIPLVVASWNLQGFGCAVWVRGHSKQVQVAASYIVDEGKENSMWGELEEYLPDPVYSKLNPKLYVQCHRLYLPGTYEPERYCILGDADMMVGSSFLHRDFDKVNVFGHDLTGYGQVPMCYVGMTAGKWEEIMAYTERNMVQDVREYGQADSEDWYRAWGVDQDILTARLRLYGFNRCNFINRGHDALNAGLPLGRWDRHNWVQPRGEVHDIHLLRQPHGANFDKIYAMLYTVYPREDWSWVLKYREAFNVAAG